MSILSNEAIEWKFLLSHLAMKIQRFVKFVRIRSDYYTIISFLRFGEHNQPKCPFLLKKEGYLF